MAEKKKAEVKKAPAKKSAPKKAVQKVVKKVEQPVGPLLAKMGGKPVMKGMLEPLGPGMAQRPEQLGEGLGIANMDPNDFGKPRKMGGVDVAQTQIAGYGGEDFVKAMEQGQAAQSVTEDGSEFDADEAMQWAAMASALGSAFAPPQVRPPSLRGGGGGFSLKSVYGGR